MDSRSIRELLLAFALSMLVLAGWQYMFASPEYEKRLAQREAAEARERSLAEGDLSAPAPLAFNDDDGDAAPFASPLAEASASDSESERDGRIAIDTPSLRGSIALRGGRFDRLTLRAYRESVTSDSAEIELLRSSRSSRGGRYHVDFGWRIASAEGGGSPPVPDERSLWTLAPGSGSVLSPDSPIALTWDNGEGLLFRREIRIDERYMISVRQEVENRSGETIRLAPWGRTSRYELPSTTGFFILHEGMIGFLEDALEEIDYGDVSETPRYFKSLGGWLGFTDKYWATALIPDQTRRFAARFSDTGSEGRHAFHADFSPLESETLPDGGSASSVTRLFAGAKVAETVDAYQAGGERVDGVEGDGPIVNFGLMIDWGWFYFITKPMFEALHYLQNLTGNFGVAILVLTALIKLAFLPLANKSYASMSRMKALQPQVEAIRERHADDRMKMQEEVMALYRKENVSPLSGCLPILLQMPVFFALYKVLFVTIEMRHAPFYGWIADLSAPDPTSLFNLFGLLPWTPPSLLSVGVWPVLMGITMFLQMRLNPAPPDPTQRLLFTWMPLVFTFLLAAFPAGLVIYWTWNNVISIAQQYVIMRRHGVKADIWGNIRETFGGAPSSASLEAKALADANEAAKADAKAEREAEASRDDSDDSEEKESDDSVESDDSESSRRKRRRRRDRRRRRRDE